MNRIAAALTLALLAAAAHLQAQAQTLKLRILGTTDVHMSLMSYDYYQDKAVDDYGLARTATLIKAARAEAKNTLLLDNGDLLQGNPLGDYVARVKPLADGHVHPAYKVMNALGYDAANVGNHEFNYGLPYLRTALPGANFPIVNANVLLDEGPRKGENAFKVRAYETGAQAIDDLKDDLGVLVDEGRLTEVRGIGESVGLSHQPDVGLREIPEFVRQCLERRGLLGRVGIGAELKPSYFRQAIKNVQAAAAGHRFDVQNGDLFESSELAEAA